MNDEAEKQIVSDLIYRKIVSNVICENYFVNVFLDINLELLHGLGIDIYEYFKSLYGDSEGVAVAVRIAREIVDANTSEDNRQHRSFNIIYNAFRELYKVR